MQATPIRSWSLVAALLVMPACDVDDSSSIEDLPRGALLFGLTDDDVVEIHARYLPEEDLALVRARVTAPFDCALYDDLCAQVGEPAALEITERQVELALEGVTAADMEAQLATWITDAMAEVDEDEDEGAFRTSGAWATKTKGDYRLRVRNGVTTPIIGQRQAWTKSNLQHEDWLGIWWDIAGNELCANTGLNEQTSTFYSAGPTVETVLEAFNPAKQCTPNASNFTQTTYHARNTGWEEAHLALVFEIEVHGCGSAEINGSNLSICASPHFDYY